ncbi:MAG: hypothetical protein AB1568_15815 [Thermodesulfobacteriota bacterium]
MKIYDITSLKPAGEFRRSNGAAGDADFRTLLQAEMAGTAAVTGAGPVAAVQPVSGVAPAVRLEGLALTENVLGLLDEYAAALANPALAGDDLEPFVASLEENTGGLLAVKGQLPADDPLAGVLERVAAVSFLESAKFRRGDYSG